MFFFFSKKGGDAEERIWFEKKRKINRREARVRRALRCSKICAFLCFMSVSFVVHLSIQSGKIIL